jgi:hypothetical protein
MRLSARLDAGRLHRPIVAAVTSCSANAENREAGSAEGGLTPERQWKARGASFGKHGEPGQEKAGAGLTR